LTSFHKQQYVALARILRTYTTKEIMLEKLLALFEADNPRFNKYIFLEACGIPQTVECGECKAKIPWKEAYYQPSTPYDFLCKACEYGSPGSDEL